MTEPVAVKTVGFENPPMATHGEVMFGTTEDARLFSPSMVRQAIDIHTARYSFCEDKVRLLDERVAELEQKLRVADLQKLIDGAEQKKDKVNSRDERYVMGREKVSGHEVNITNTNSADGEGVRKALEEATPQIIELANKRIYDELSDRDSTLAQSVRQRARE